MKRSLPIIVVLVASAAAYLAVSRFGASRNGGTGLIEASGRVEGDSVVIAARSTGVVTELLVREGESVSRGQIVARLQESRPSEYAAADTTQGKQALASLEAKLRSEQAELAVLQARVPLAIRAAEANVTLTRAVLQQCENAEDQHRREVERLRAIPEPDDDTRTKIDEAELAHEQAEQDVVVAQAAVERAESDLELARLGRDEIVAQIAEVDAIRAEKESVESALNTSQVAAANMTVLAPAAGVIAIRRAEIGDEAEAGTALFELSTRDAMCVMAEIPDAERHGIALGQAARVHLENAPDQPLDAKVAAMTPRANGAATVWSVKLVPTAHDARQLELGKRVDVVIRIREGAAWRAPRR